MTTAALRPGGRDGGRGRGGRRPTDDDDAPGPTFISNPVGAAYGAAGRQILGFFSGVGSRAYFLRDLVRALREPTTVIQGGVVV